MGRPWAGSIDRSVVLCSSTSTSERPDHLTVPCLFTKVQLTAWDTDTPADTEK